MLVESVADELATLAGEQCVACTLRMGPLAPRSYRGRRQPPSQNRQADRRRVVMRKTNTAALLASQQTILKAKQLPQGKQ